MGFFQDKSFPVAERLYRKGFYIPSGMALTDQQMEVVIKAVKEVFA
jgi:perosamine synthetase